MISHGLSQTTMHSRDISFSPRNEVYVPDSSVWNASVDTEKEKKETKDKKPPYSGDKLGSDLTKSPGKEFEWKGKGGPESGKSSWINNETGHRLHPDLDHPPPKKTHWDYKGPEGEARLNTDGTWEWK